MNLAKTFKGSDLIDVEIQINNFIQEYEGELLTAQIEFYENGMNSFYAAIIVYKQSIPNQK